MTIHSDRPVGMKPGPCSMLFSRLPNPPSETSSRRTRSVVPAFLPRIAPDAKIRREPLLLEKTPDLRSPPDASLPIHRPLDFVADDVVHSVGRD